MLDWIRRWWIKPTSREERVWAVLCGLFGGACYGVVFGLMGLATMLTDDAISMMALLYLALAGSVLMGLLAVFLPRLVRVLVFPFTFLFQLIRGASNFSVN